MLRNYHIILACLFFHQSVNNVNPTLSHLQYFVYNSWMKEPINRIFTDILELLFKQDVLVIHFVMTPQQFFSTKSFSAVTVQTCFHDVIPCKWLK